MSVHPLLSAPLLDPEMHSLILTTIDYIYNEKYAEAEENTWKIIRKYPAHPAGYFFMAGSIDSWMAAHLSDKKEEEFYHFCDLAIDKGEKILEKDPTNQWVTFFIGGAEGFKGTYEARYERWITAFRYGWKGVSILMRLLEQKCDFIDIQYGIGSYEYWRSSLMKSLWWMPGVEDKRKIGIERLEKVRKDGVYSKVAAISGLIDIYCNERNYDEALNVANGALEKYPDCRIFLLGKIRALFGLKRFEEAEGASRLVLARVEGDPNENHATIALCHYWIAKSDFGIERFADCIAECDLMKNYDFNDDSKKAMEKYFTEISELKKLAIIERKNMQTKQH